MNGHNPVMRAAATVVAVAVALRLAVELIEPVAGFLIGAIALIGIVLLVRWWQANRW